MYCTELSCFTRLGDDRNGGRLEGSNESFSLKFGAGSEEASFRELNLLDCVEGLLELAE